MSAGKSCDLCGNENLRSVLQLGDSPPTCGGEGTLPLNLLYCDDCGLAQLSETVDPEVSFPPDYTYSSGNSKALRENFADLAAHARESVGAIASNNLVVDIGANDGTLLSNFVRCKTVGVEPTRQARRIRGPRYEEFFSEELAKRIREEHGAAKVITACNVLAHVEDVHDVMRGINHLLADNGVLIAENHDLGSVVGGQWDTIYHEHLRFFDARSFSSLLSMHGLGAREWRDVPTHGGSLRVVAQKVLNQPAQPEYDFAQLQADAARTRDAVRELADGIWGIGATARATTLINYCDLDVEDIECVCEVAGSDKIGRHIPGTHIPVIEEDALFEQQPEKIMLFSWHLADSIVPKLREQGYEGEIIVPLPEVRSL